MTFKLPRPGPGMAIALFFGVLIAFNVAFYVIAAMHPPEPVVTEVITPAEAP